MCLLPQYPTQAYPAVRLLRARKNCSMSSAVEVAPQTNPKLEESMKMCCEPDVFKDQESAKMCRKPDINMFGSKSSNLHMQFLYFGCRLPSLVPSFIL